MMCQVLGLFQKWLDSLVAAKGFYYFILPSQNRSVSVIFLCIFQHHFINITQLLNNYVIVKSYMECSVKKWPNASVKKQQHLEFLKIRY